MGRSERNKGLVFERKLVRMFRDEVPGTEACRIYGEEAKGNSGDVLIILPFESRWGSRIVVQAKHRKKPNPWAALREAKEAAEINVAYPVAIVSKINGPKEVWFDVWLEGFDPEWEVRRNRITKDEAWVLPLTEFVRVLQWDRTQTLTEG